MRVLILGGGTVGTSVAEVLCQQRHSVTLVERNEEIAGRIDAEMDITVVTGAASQSSTLFQAGVTSADVCFALTGNDECNMVAASLAKAMGASRVAARVYSKIFRDLSTFDYQNHFKIDRFLSIEHLTAMEMSRCVRETGTMVIEYFARGQLEMQDVIISRGSSATGKKLADLKFPSEVRIGSINRDGNTRIATANDQIEVGDRISILGDRSAVEEVKKLFNTQPARKQCVIIAGGGETGYHLAQVLESRRYSVTIMDSSRDRCDYLASHLQNVTILRSNALRRRDLEEGRISEVDIFVSCTGSDEDNILSCVEAGELGAKMTIAVVTRADYGNIISRLGISKAVSPRKVMAQQVQGLMNAGPIIFRNPYLLGGGIEVLELEVRQGSPVTRGTLREISLPAHALIAAVIREGFVHVPGANHTLYPGDTVIVLIQAGFIPELIKVFEAD
ncbi:MAG: Trk system potassium transporter TrkA [Planctomycetaceae bacterium]|jgi:trk system potassium uptake protein TrkA|nr:Trk system potassium transporter TrkA [Planctomycetaceae bacterium]